MATSRGPWCFLEAPTRPRKEEFGEIDSVGSRVHCEQEHRLARGLGFYRQRIPGAILANCSMARSPADFTSSSSELASFPVVPDIVSVFVKFPSIAFSG